MQCNDAIYHMHMQIRYCTFGTCTITLNAVPNSTPPVIRHLRSILSELSALNSAINEF